jgi:hypothetical protein
MREVVTVSLKFNVLLRRALLEWPEVADLSVLVRHDPLSDRYSVKGLYDLSDAREAHYIGSTEEIIMRNLHNSIFGVLHEAALCVSRIRPADLREAAIRVRFEKHLKNCMEMPELRFLPADIELGKRYFAENEGGGTR